MILIADSGSTKVHWCLVTASGQCSDVFTDGINPLFQTCDAMRNSISNQLLPKISSLLWAGTLTHVFFYGAGCTPEKKVYVQRALEGVFKKAEVQVESDMVGAARGLLGHQPGVACILGTGSGSCYYDGEKIAWSVPSLGYILGDEGSAAVLGKRLVGDLLKNQMGQRNDGLMNGGLMNDGLVDLKELFFEEYQTSMAEIIEKVYRQPFPNRYLAGLSRFCADHMDDPRIHDLVYDHFVQFIRRNLMQYFEKNDQMVNDKMVNSQMVNGQMVNAVGFVGSVAYYYKPILEEAMVAEGIPLGIVLQDPIEGLKEYHKDAVVPTTE
ncbi:MAG: ATPase [Paludibacteraceae bacterium]|nr:ATPase [Paludibacteraceae bacterium]